MKKPVLIIGNKNYSSWSLRAWLLLKAFGIDFEEQFIDLLEPSAASVLKANSPTSKVPVLVQDNDDSETIKVWDSLAIAIYTNDYLTKTDIWSGHNSFEIKNPTKKEYSNLKIDRAYCQSIVAEMHSGFMNIRSEMPMNVVEKVRIEPTSACLNDIARIEYIFAECLATRPIDSYLFGHFTVADVFFAPIVLRLQTYAQASEVDLKPITEQYCQTMLHNPHVEAWQGAARQEMIVINKD